ncbi:hypothetical protein B0T16DRAFT_402541 [Cercophora newfieldiana]|uniref:Uncharacterized protein n=1 Tax=Cercophora newfieldiana TaxID=92897 RepID=A0AA39YSI4_9PEZI|nr:hypothetical protein B0T16DRAFT_402541 [Cercophora newfieldiana]
MSTNDLDARLAKQHVDMDSCVAAMRGERVPWAIGNPLMQLCLVRGIRYHAGFGAEVRSATPVLTRAWNARRIMSNDVPAVEDMSDPDHVPYCIWHPDVASESTYRTLARRFPQMRYQVARACAVAGYLDLYRDLDVLPEVHVAEEARHNGNLDIFNDIMSQPVRYSVMDDYYRTINTANPKTAYLNGDTAVRSTLECKRKIEMPEDLRDIFDSDFLDGDDGEDDEEPYYSQRFKPGYFNITEDGYIDTHNGYSPEKEISTMTESSTGPDLISPLLYSPLPQDLPDGNKDVLILMAAYYGDIDRYARLRRPVAIRKQIECVVRGIFHNTLFAKWWADRLKAAGDDEPGKKSRISLDGMAEAYMRGIRKAITARFIMNNDLSRVTSTTPADELPYCIWYPGLPTGRVLEELVRRRPEMRQQAARACIVAGAFETFRGLDPDPDAALLAEAERVGNPAFGQFLRNKIEQAGPDFVLPRFTFEDWKMLTRVEIHEPMLSPSVLHRVVDEKSVGVAVSFPGIYEGFGVDTGVLELSVGARDTMKEGEESVELEKLYGPP